MCFPHLRKIVYCILKKSLDLHAAMCLQVLVCHYRCIEEEWSWLSAADSLIVGYRAGLKASELLFCVFLQ